MDISMDIHEKSVDMDMDMDVIFHIHGNPAGHRLSTYSKYITLTSVFSYTFPVTVKILNLSGCCLWFLC